MTDDALRGALTNGRQLAFEVAYRVTAGVGITITVMRHLYAAVSFTLVSVVLCGLAYPMFVTGAAQLLLPSKANGSLIESHGVLVGSRLIGQPFEGPGYFWPRPSAAGKGYDATVSGGSNLAPTSATLLARIGVDRRRLANTDAHTAVPVELVTASASGLDPHLSPAGAAFQIPRVARVRGIRESALRRLVAESTEPRQVFGLLGEPRVNVLLLNAALDARYPRSAKR